jgi:hypothetical protein
MESPRKFSPADAFVPGDVPDPRVREDANDV